MFTLAGLAAFPLRLGNLEPELEQFTMDARSTPQWVSLLIRWMSSRSSWLTLGLPGRPDLQRQ
jgi:hypothetical protein